MKFFVIGVLLLISTGCIYKTDVHQGNVISNESLEKLETGMTQDQVLSLLGSPLITDAFHSNRWDYYSYSKTGKKRLVDQKLVTLNFSDGLLTSIAR